MKSIILAVGLLAVFIGLLICLRQFCVEKPPPIVVSSDGPHNRAARTLEPPLHGRVYVADVLIGQSDNSKGAFLIRGDALLVVDMSKATIVEKDESVKRATVRLPQPEVLQARVDHERTKTWEVRARLGSPGGQIKIAFATRCSAKPNSWSPRPLALARTSSTPSVPPRSSSPGSTSTSAGPSTSSGRSLRRPGCRRDLPTVTTIRAWPLLAISRAGETAHPL